MSNRLTAFPQIGLIGPVLPYRGGIAQYTTLLHRNLRSKSELFTISFRRQYPGWLYPGRCDIDRGFDGHQESGVSYILDSLNPSTWLKACRFLIRHSTCAVIIPWWTVFWAPCFGFVANYLRGRGIKVLFLCHNVIDHESTFWKVMVTKRVLSQGTNFLVHTNNDADRLANLIPETRITVHPHPIYNQFPPSQKNLPRRARLELLFYGLVRPYKGLDILIEAMQLLKNEDIFLTVAGEWWDRDPVLQRRISDLKEKVEVVDRYVTQEETAEYFSRADVVVLPYRSASGTGVIPIAYHYGKPVIATTVGGLPEVVVDGVSGQLVKPEDPQALSDIIREFLYKDPADMYEGVKRTAESMTWDSLADCILGLMSKKAEYNKNKTKVMAHK